LRTMHFLVPIRVLHESTTLPFTTLIRFQAERPRGVSIITPLPQLLIPLTTELDDSAAIYTTADVDVPTNGDDWVLQVSMPSGGTLQVNQVFLGAYDVIN